MQNVARDDEDEVLVTDEPFEPLLFFVMNPEERCGECGSRLTGEGLCANDDQHQQDRRRGEEDDEVVITTRGPDDQLHPDNVTPLFPDLPAIHSAQRATA